MFRGKGSRSILGPCLLAVLIIPFTVLVLWAFTGQWPADSILPTRLGLRGWLYMFSPHGKVLPGLVMSVLLSLAVTFCALVISIPAGKALGLYDFPGKGLIELLVLAPIIIPSITVGMGLHTAFIKFGLADSFAGVLLVHLMVVLPYGIRIFASGYKAMGSKWEDQARVLRAGWWQRFIYVTLPFLYPAMVAGGILIFNVSFAQYFLTFLIGGGRIITLPLILFPYINGGDRVVASAISLVFIAASLLLMAVIENTVKDRQEETAFYYM
ncbi:MAG: ABC transporter permease subunit [Firmicutes bacterium]|nr:ABC transporter permease subunit [Bacillota bacterium]